MASRCLTLCILAEYWQRQLLTLIRQSSESHAIPCRQGGPPLSPSNLPPVEKTKGMKQNRNKSRKTKSKNKIEKQNGKTNSACGKEKRKKQCTVQSPPPRSPHPECPPASSSLSHPLSPFLHHPLHPKRDCDHLTKLRVSKVSRFRGPVAVRHQGCSQRGDGGFARHLGGTTSTCWTAACGSRYTSSRRSLRALTGAGNTCP